MARTDPQVNLRMPAELKDRLDEAAELNKRSLTAETVARLEASFEGPVASLALAQLQAEVLEREWLQRGAQLRFVAAVQLLKQITMKVKAAGVELSATEAQALEELRFHAAKIAVDQDVTAKRVQMKLESAAKKLVDAQDFFNQAVKD